SECIECIVVSEFCFYGNAALLLKQLVAIGATYAFTIIMTYTIIKAINFFLPVRVDEHEEHMGLGKSISCVETSIY
ncbi:hypothetical protein ACT453_19490, partial [Bacillus sp. D-CC]